MRIAFVNQDPGIDPERHKGAAVHLRAMRDAFTQLGARVLAFDESDDRHLRQRLHAEHSSSAIDLVYERYALGKSVAAEFATEHGIPHVVEANAPLAEEARHWRGVDADDDVTRAADRFALLGATMVLAVSTPVAEYVRARGARTDTVHVVPNGVDTALFRPRNDDRLRDQLAPSDSLVLGFHGRLRPWHGFDRLAETCRELIKRGVPAHLVAVGVGGFDEVLRGRLEQANHTLVGWQPHEEMGRYVATFDVLPLCYAGDAPFYFSPLKLAEAMACAVVPVVPNLGDLACTVVHGHNGLVYDVDQPGALTDAVQWLADHPEDRARLATGAVETATELSWHRIARLVLDGVSETTGTHSLP